MTRTVVFDVGDVLVPTLSLHAVVGAGLGLPEAEFLSGFWTGRGAYDLGGAASEYWTGVLGAWGREADPDLMAELERRDAERWSVLPDEQAALVAERAAAGDRLALLSNAPAPLASAVRAAAWSDPFDVLVFSCDLGVGKPDPELFARAAALLGPGETVFLDDKAENVEAARAHGWDAHVWVGVEDAREWLAR